MSLRMRQERAIQAAFRAERGSPWVVRKDASTRNQRRRAMGVSEFADIVRVLRCGQQPRAWCKSDDELRAWVRERNRRKAVRRGK